MPTLNDFITEIITGEYGLDIVNYGKDANGDFQPFEVNVDGKQYVIDEQLATKLDTLIAKDFATETKLEAVRALLELVEGKDFATETTLDTRLNSLETKIDTLNGKIDSVNTNINDSQDSDNNINVSQKGSKATDAVAVTPDDVNDLAQVPTDGLYVGIGGNIKVDMADGTTVTFTALKGGVVYPFEVSRIYDTDTTATNIVALY